MGKLSIKGVMSWPNVSSLVFRFWSPPWTNGPNTQLKWKLRYSPIHCAYLKSSATHFLDRRRNRIGLDRKLTQSCWCLHWFFGLRAVVSKILLQVHIRTVVTQVWIEKMHNKNIEVVFQSAVWHLCQRALVPLLHNDRGPNATTSI